MVFNTIRISRTILEEDILVPTDTYKEIIGHLCLDNLYKPPLHQSLPSCNKVSCVWSAALVAEGGSVLWCPFCMFYNPACSIFYGVFCGLGFFWVFCHWFLSQLLAVMNWESAGINQDIQMQREGLLQYFSFRGSTWTCSVNTSNITAHYLSILTRISGLFLSPAISRTLILPFKDTHTLNGRAMTWKLDMWRRL